MQNVAHEITPEQLAFSKLIPYAALQNPNYQVTPLHSHIAEHLEKVERGEIKRLCLFVPPRCGKTTLASEYFPAWFLGRNPDKQVIFTTYSFDRAKDVGRKIRNQMVGNTHGSVFPGCVVDPNSKGVTSLSTTSGGVCNSVGIGGGITGRGAHLFIIDDPIKGREDAESDLIRSKILDWYKAVAYTRMMPGGRIVIIMTRWHFDDLAGNLLENTKHENWTVIEFPAIAEENDMLGRKRGDPLWPTWYPKQVLNNIKLTIGTREWNSLYQQKPVPGEGGMIQIDWFKYYNFVNVPDIKDDFKQIVCSWDTAFKAKELNDPTCCTVWGVTNSEYYLLNVVNKRFEYPALKREVKRVYNYNLDKYELTPTVLIEDKASGQSLIQDLKDTTTMPIVAITHKGDKELRMSETSALIEAGKVILPRNLPWVSDYETQMIQFPYSKHDDMVDSTSQFLKWMKRKKYRRSTKPLYWK